ncbi:unnamed protein product [Coregonus sp. 'balchen']|nr:unnamed protein product [Coregonus sp. 'balchen']
MWAMTAGRNGPLKWVSGVDGVTVVGSAGSFHRDTAKDSVPEEWGHPKPSAPGAVSGRHGIPSPMSLRRQHSKLPPTDVFNDIMYMVGGWNQEDPSCPVERFCPLENEWKNMASMINHRGNVAVCSLGGNIYTVGGSDGVTCKRSVESGVCLVEMEGYLYALGGYDGMVCTNTVERYNPIMNSWIKRAPMLSRRSVATAAVMDGQLYVIGGNDGDTPMNTEEFIDFDTNSSKCCIVLMSLIVFNGSLLAVGGSDGITNLKTIEFYNHESNTWRHFGSMKTKHPGGHVAMLKTKHGYSL